MRNVLIIGANSYIGNAFESFAREQFNIKKISSREDAWKSADFSNADCVLYCAGIAHRKAENALHFAVNCDLAVKVAEKAKRESVAQFVYLSSAAVYGKPSGELNSDTIPNPAEPYGQSKLKAENELKTLQDNNFIVTIIRPPMVYGADCKGNFQRLLKLAQTVSIFPDIDNKRSMIYIENLCHFLCLIIGERRSGIFFPQNAEYISTTELFINIRESLGKNTRLTKVFNPPVYLLTKHISTFEKLFGNFAYKGIECENIDYVDFKESVKRSVQLTRLRY